MLVSINRSKGRRYSAAPCAQSLQDGMGRFIKQYKDRTALDDELERTREDNELLLLVSAKLYRCVQAKSMKE